MISEKTQADFSYDKLMCFNLNLECQDYITLIVKAYYYLNCLLDVKCNDP